MLRYDHKKIEKKWRKAWEKEGAYEPDVKRAKNPFYNLMMFPYPSAEGLHIGGVRTFTGVDIYGRYKRMEGHDVFEPMGLDGFGIHSENHALKTGQHPMEHAKRTEKNFYRQLEEMGNGFAWDEKLETYDPGYYRWTQWILLKLFERGLMYRKKQAVNWCPKDLTVLSDEQVVDGCCERCGSKVEKKELEQWSLKITNYAGRLLKNLEKLDWSEKIKIAQRNWIGESHGALISFPIARKFDFVFVHGYNASPAMNFWPGLKKEITSHGFPVFAPKLPKPADHEIESKVKFLLKNTKFSKDAIIVAHSLGCVVAIKALQESKKKIAKLILVSPPDPGKTDRHTFSRMFDSTNARKWEVGSFEDIKHRAEDIVVIEDMGDPFVPAEESDRVAKKLGARIIKTRARWAHFTGPDAPEILQEAKTWIDVFTTRPDTLFGATYMVLSPEHPLVTGFLEVMSRRPKNDAVAKIEHYVKSARERPEEERVDAGREKTGVEIKGFKVINPVNKQELPVWISDYVLASYGTGAIMAVPAHDERDFAFAKKFKLPIKFVVEPTFGSAQGDDARKKAVFVVVRNPKDNTAIVLDWGPRRERHGGKMLIGGGVEGDESYRAAAEREIIEETGYKNFTLVAESDFVGHSYFFSNTKNKNMHVSGKGLLYDLVNEEKAATNLDDGEKGKFKVTWQPIDKIADMLDDGIHRAQFRYLALHEPYCGTGILASSGKFTGMDSEKAKWEIAKFAGGKKMTTYRLRDWIISRQRYWGPPIPFIYCTDCAKHARNPDWKGQKTLSIGEKENPGWVPVPEKDLPVELPYVKDFRPTGTGVSPLASIKSFYEVKCPRCGNKARRETDVSDTFLDSAWYFLRYPSANVKSKAWDPAVTSRWLPVDSYIGGAEHAVLHLLYARFVTMAFRDMRYLSFEEPFTKFRAHGLITKDGAKMSKSKGNVVNPDEYIANFGADAVRMYLAFLAPFEEGGDFSDKGILGPARFLERIWRFGSDANIRMHANDTNAVDPSIEKLLHKTIKKVGEDINSLRYNTAISALMILLNEFEKSPPTPAQFKTFLKLLAPFAPYMTEEIWWGTFGEKKSIHLASWPRFDPKRLREDAFTLIVQVNGKVRDSFEAPIDISEAEAKRLALAREKVKIHLANQEPKKVIYVPKRLVNIVV